MMKKPILFAVSIAVALTASGTQADVNSDTDARVYAGFPVTLKGYSGDEQTSVAYTGQIARHVLHNSLRALSKTGDKAMMMQYFKGKDAGRAILSPKSRDGFRIKQTEIAQLSGKKNLAGKAYKGAVTGWPGNMTGVEVLAFMINKAATTEQGYDPVNGYDYAQLISKTLMGAVFYHQAVDNYLDEKLEAGNKPNNKPYKQGTHYTGKEHVWDEGFGYFGASAHAMALDANTLYDIAKQKPGVFKAADANGDGVVDLLTEMTYGHAYYAANADKGGQSRYLNTIMAAYIDGRQLIADAGGEVLTDAQRTKLKAYAQTIKTNWEKVIAEATYKYAGSVYKDLKAIESTIEHNGDIRKVMRQYAKHWGELKGFSLALQMGGKDLGETAVKLNRLIGFGPALLGNTQVTGIDDLGNYIQTKRGRLGDYMGHMIKVQNLLDARFRLVAKGNRIADDLATALSGVQPKANP